MAEDDRRAERVDAVEDRDAPGGLVDVRDQRAGEQRLERRDGANLFVRGLDCLDGTPLVDLKPDRSEFIPLAPPKPGDFQVGEPRS